LPHLIERRSTRGISGGTWQPVDSGPCQNNSIGVPDKIRRGVPDKITIGVPDKITIGNHDKITIGNPDKITTVVPDKTRTVVPDNNTNSSSLAKKQQR
jgi:hypothetical protein